VVVIYIDGIHPLNKHYRYSVYWCDWRRYAAVSAWNRANDDNNISELCVL